MSRVQHSLLFLVSSNTTAFIPEQPGLHFMAIVIQQDAPSIWSANPLIIAATLDVLTSSQLFSSSLAAQVLLLYS